MNNNNIRKKELININSLYFLYNHRNVPQDDKIILKKIHKNIQSGYLNVDYQYLNDRKNNKLGFLYAVESSLQNLTEETRNFMTKELYYLIDMSDILIYILIDWTDKNKLHNYSIKQFINKNTDKSIILSILFGNVDTNNTKLISSLIDEINNIGKWAWDNYKDYRSMTIDYLDKKRESHKKKKTMLLYNILCTIVNSIILQTDKFLTSKGRIIDTFIFDKVLIRKFSGELLFPEKLASDCENNIREIFGIDMALNVSEITSSYNNNTQSHNIVPYNVAVNPRYAAEKFKQLMGNNVVFNDNKLWIYDDDSGVYYADMALLASKITKHKDSLVFKQYNKNMDEKYYDYHGDLDKRKNMIKILPETCNIPDFFKNKLDKMGDGKILFRKKYGYGYAVTRYDDNNNPDLTRVKLGYLKNIKIEREIYNNYSRTLTPICVLYILPTADAELTEKIIHHALDKVRVDPNHEIFNLNLKSNLDIYYDTVNMIKTMDKNSGKEMPWRINVSYKYWQVAIEAAKIGRKKLMICEKKVESTKQKKKLELKNNTHNDIRQSLLNTFYRYYERTVICNDSKVHISHITDVINKYSGISKKNENEIKEILKSVDITQKKTTMRLNGNPVRGWYIGYKLKEKL